MSNRWQGTADTSGKRPSVYMGPGTAKQHEKIKGHLVALQRAGRAGQQAPADTLAWLGSIGDELHARVAKKPSQVVSRFRRRYHSNAHANWIAPR